MYVGGAFNPVGVNEACRTYCDGNKSFLGGVFNSVDIDEAFRMYCDGKKMFLDGACNSECNDEVFTACFTERSPMDRTCNLGSVNVAFRLSCNWNKLTTNWTFNPTWAPRKHSERGRREQVVLEWVFDSACNDEVLMSFLRGCHR